MTEDRHDESVDETVEVSAQADELVGPSGEPDGIEDVGLEPSGDEAADPDQEHVAASARGGKGLVLALLGVAVVTAGFAASVWAARATPQVNAAMEASDCNT